MPRARTSRSSKDSRPLFFCCVVYLAPHLSINFLNTLPEQQPCSYGVCRVGSCVSPLLRRRSNCCCKASNSWSDQFSKSIRLLRAPCTPWMSSSSFRWTALASRF